ncbi:hypothetical protein COO60DRAFT_234531 [Scenedesmus sp. NREL 46B-D3]|nr:hypothetical protein COO60DRAFT_234531 [Scenedesmus sp. NREL 46B-D3]
MQRTQQQRQRQEQQQLQQREQQQQPPAKPGTGRHTVIKAETAAAAAAPAAAGAAGGAANARRAGGAGSGGAPAAATDSSWRADYNRTDVKHGRFGDDERAAIAAAIQEYAEERGLPYALGECDWLVERAAAGHKRGAITAIAAALPQRTRKAVWQFVRANYTPTEAQGKWSATEDARLLALYSELGPKWKEIGGRLGRLDRACRDRARDLNYGQPLNTGRWGEDEVDMLQNLVASYRQAVALTPQGDAPRTISDSLLPSEGTEARPVACTTLDNIDWTFVARQMGTRTSRQCAEKWHAGLAPTMVEAGQWGRGDDKRLINSLAAAGAAEAYQVAWGSLVPGRTAEQCQRRWRLVLKHLPVEVRSTFAAAVAEAAARVRQSEEKAAQQQQQQ